MADALSRNDTPTESSDLRFIAEELDALRVKDVPTRRRELIADGLRLMTELTTVMTPSREAQLLLVRLMRMLVRCVMQSRDHDLFDGFVSPFSGRRPSAIGRWAEGMLRAAVLDHPGALGKFEEALADSEASLPLNLRCEIALLHERHGFYADSWRAFAEAKADGLDAATQAFYGPQLAKVEQVHAFCGPCELYPERLIDIILDEATTAPIGYPPRPGQVTTVMRSLAMGGGERQAVKLMGALARSDEVSGQSLLLRAMGPGLDFHVEEVRRLPIDVIVYGPAGSSGEQDDLARLTMLKQRPRLRQALDLLPSPQREDVLRLSSALLECRPEVVQIRSDMYEAALACAVAGAPCFYARRGELARDRWPNAGLQAIHYDRPLRHAYRRLLETTPFCIINSSEAGRASDIAFTGWPEGSRFLLVRKSIDFERLGPSGPPNAALRDEIGIPVGAPLVGGVFRIAFEKRPLLWIETARHVLEREPAAHFVIVGDGLMRSQVLQYAASQGFEDRLHLPGVVDNVGDWYRAMDVMLLTSEVEGVANVLIEAQHFGLPVVSSDVGGVRQAVIPGVTARLAPRDAAAEVFAAEVLAALTDQAWRAAAAARGPAFVHAAYDLADTVERMIPHYRLGEGFRTARTAPSAPGRPGPSARG